MSLTRRLKGLEGSLSPRGAVGLWLAVVQQRTSTDAYVRSVLDAPPTVTPLGEMVDAVEGAVRRARADQTPEVIADAVRRATGDTVFLHQLALRINDAAVGVAGRASLEAAYLAFIVRLLLDDPRSSEPEGPDPDRPATGVLDVRWCGWCDLVALLVDLVSVEEAARARLEHPYFDGRSVLFPDEARTWAALRAQIEQLSEHLETLPPAITLRARRSPAEWPLPSDSFTDRVAARAVELADDARIVAFERLGEPERARRILEARLWVATYESTAVPAPSDERD